MSQRLLQMLVFSGMILGATIILLWTFLWNKGHLEVQADTPFTVTIEGSISQECVESPCKISIKPSVYDITFSKDGYFDEVRSIEINRWETSSEEINFNFIAVYNDIPEEAFLAEKSILNTVLPEEYSEFQKSAQFLTESTFIYFHPEEKRIRKYENNEDSIVAQFQNIDTLLLAGIEKNSHILATSNQGTYVIHVTNGSKQKLSDKEYTYMKWDPSGSYCILENEGNLDIFDIKMKSISSLNIDAQAKNILWLDTETLIYGHRDGFSYYSLLTNEAIGIMASQNIEIDEMFLSESKKRIYFRVFETYYVIQFAP